MNGPFIRLAVPSEQMELERLQLRASLENAGDRDALLAHPDAIELPVEQIDFRALPRANRVAACRGNPIRAATSALAHYSEAIYFIVTP